MIENNKVPKIRFEGFTDAWEQRTFEEIVDFLDTQRKPLEEAAREKGPYPYYGASGIVDYVAGYIFDEELILLSEDGANITDRNYPVCFLASGKYWVNNHAHVLRAKKNYENNFICNSMERKDYGQYNTGMAMPKLNQEVCRRIPVSCPSFQEQKKIGDFFRSLDNLITLHKRKYDKLVVMKKSLLEKMFPKNGSNIPEIRFAGFTDAWEQRKVSELIEDYMEKTTIQNQYPVLTSSQQQGIVLQEEYFADRQVTTNDNIGYFVLPKGYFTYRSRSDTDIFVFNRNNIINKGIISYYYPVFKAKGTDSNFLLRRLNHGIRKQLSMAAEGTGQKVLAHSKFKNMVVDIPSCQEQEKIGAYFENLDNLITLRQRKLEKLKKIKKAMLEKMFV